MKTYIKYLLGIVVAVTQFVACSDDDNETSALRISTLITKDVYWDQATVMGKIDIGQQRDIVEMGFYCDTLSNLLDNPQVMHLVCDGEEFTGTFDNLKPEKQYYVQAYVRTNNGETIYGNKAMFATTKVYTLSIEKNDPAYTGITGRGVTLSGLVTEDSGVHIGYVGAKFWKADLQESSAEEVEIALHPEAAPGNGENFSIELNDLLPNTAYKAYVGARNSRGMVYSELIEFSTANIVPATVTTGTLDIVGLTSVAVIDNIAGDNGADPQTTYGMYIYPVAHDSETPQQSWLKIEGVPDATGKFNTSYELLEMDTDYIIRAYAENYAGTKLGDKIAFKTLSQQEPTVSTIKYKYSDYFEQAEGSDLNLGLDYLYMRGNLTNAGGLEVTASGFEWGTSPASLNNQLSAQLNTNINTITTRLSGLTNPGERIYYRVWAENSVGKGFGEVQSITVPVKSQAWKKGSDGKTTVQDNGISRYYYELDAIEVQGGEQYIFLDRNLGATERVTNINETLYPGGGTAFVPGMFNTVGDYYKFGANTPVLTVDASPANSNSNWNDVADASVSQDGLDGSGNWTQSQPCPPGYVIPTADQWIKIMNKYSDGSSSVSEQFEAIKSGLNVQGTSFFRLQGANYTLPNNYNQYSTYLPASTKNSSGLGQYLIIEYSTSSNTMLGISMNNFNNANTQTAGLPVRCMRVETVTP